MSLTIGAAFKAHLASPYQTTCTIWKVTLTNGTVLGFTDLDRDILFGGVTFKAQTGYTRTDIAGNSDLSVDNMEVDGVIDAPSITENDLREGIWDYADIKVSLINWAPMFLRYPVSTVIRTGSVVTVSTTITTPLFTGGRVEISGASPTDYNGSWSVTGNSGNFAFTIGTTPTTPATGTIWFSPNMGEMILRSGKIGEVTLERNTFKAELRGLTQAYSRTLGELTSAGCRAQLGDTRCKVALGPFTVTSTLTNVNPDQIIFYDTARTEPGPTGGIAITGISNANPGVVSVASGTTLFNDEAVTLSAIVGMPLLNNTTVIRGLSGNSFQLGVDTSNTTIWGTYASGGMVTPLGADSGYFDFGLMTMNTGVCAGLSMEVRSYVPGQWIMQLPFADGLLTPSPGDSYTMIAGCDKSMSTCNTKFSNVINFRGEPYLPGLDKIVQVGKQA
jgi:hypothetical protein